MKKQIKKGLALLGAAAMSLGIVAVPQLAASAEETEAVAYISYADSDWTNQYWGEDESETGVVPTKATVTGNGQYTVSVDFTGVEAGKASGVAFFDVEISNGEEAYPLSYMQIDSVKVNGEEVEVGNTYTSSDDGVNTRTNLYNEWVDSVTEGRTADGSDDVTATPVSADAFGDVETVEVTFTLTDGVTLGGQTLPAEGLSSYLCVADSNWAVQYWGEDESEIGVVATNATVTGAGEYTVGLDFTGVEGGVLPNIEFLDLEIAEGETYLPNTFMEIESVKVNGEEVSLGATYTSSDDEINTRTNLYNYWVESVDAGRTIDGDAGDATATPVDGSSLSDIETIEVTYKLRAGKAFAAAATGTDAESSEFTAFMMFADGSGAWENYNQGVGTECTVLGDGVYEVSLSAEQCGATGQASPEESALVFLVDITGLGDAMVNAGTLAEDAEEKLIVTDAEAKVAIYVDGVRINSKSNNIALGDIEGNGRLRLDFFNAYDGAGTAENPVVNSADLTPESEIKVVFSLSGTGLNSDADTDLDAYLVAQGYEEAAEDSTPAEEDTTTASTDDNTESSSNTGVIIIVVVAVVAVIAIVAVVVAKKKKKND